MKNTLYDKIWAAHCIRENDDNSSLIYIDRHLIHEVTSPQAFDGLEIKKRDIWNKKSILATTDHNVPTINRDKGFELRYRQKEGPTITRQFKNFLKTLPHKLHGLFKR